MHVNVCYISIYNRAKTWKKPRCPLTDEWIKMIWYIYTMEYYSAIKNWDNANLGNMDEPRGYHAEQNGPDRKTNFIGYNLYVESKKSNKHIQNRNVNIDIENKLWLSKGTGSGGIN